MGAVDSRDVSDPNGYHVGSCRRMTVRDLHIRAVTDVRSGEKSPCRKLLNFRSSWGIRPLVDDDNDDDNTMN